ncbi:extracellular solute-binding protein, partial [Melissococcus plutonius]
MEEIKPTGGKEKKGTIKLWVDAAVIDIYKPIVKQFENEHKGLKIIVKPSETGKAQENVKKDPSAAADVFMMPHDQLGQLVGAGTIYPNTKYANNVKKNNAKNLVDSATYNGKLYGYPYGMETLIAYYNKSKLTAEEMKTWETITKNGKLGTNFSEENANYVF